MASRAKPASRSRCDLGIEQLIRSNRCQTPVLYNFVKAPESGIFISDGGLKNRQILY